MKKLGAMLKELRKNMGFTQQHIADQLNVDRSTYSNYERSVTEPDIESLKKLARIFGVDINTLLCEEKAVKVADDNPVPMYMLSKEEHYLIARYRTLSENGKKAVNDTMDNCENN